MTLTITHSVVATDPQDPLLGADEWNDVHSLSGTLDQSQNNVAVDGVTITGDGTPGNPLVAVGDGTGDVHGPASSTDNAIARYDLATGKIIQNSNLILNDDGSITFTAAAPSFTANTLFADATNDSLSYYNSDSNVLLQIGQEEWVRVRNDTGVTIANGAPVYISGVHASGIPQVSLARANAAATVVCTGLATEAIANNSIGFVTCIGLVRGLNTAAFAAGATVYVSEAVAGTLTSTAPVSPNYRFRVGIVTRSHASTGTIHVTPSTGALGNGTANQVFGMNAAGTAQEVKTLGSTTSIVAVNAANSITFTRAALTGDVAAPSNSNTTTLATVNANVGTFGSATQVGTFTVNGKGLITAASNTAIQIAESQVTNLVSDLAGKQATGNYITALTGEVTAAGPGSVAATVTNSAVIGKVLTGYSSGAGTVAATDTILQAIQKLNGNDALALPLTGGTLTGNLLFSADNTKDIGASGATRPRTIYLGTSAIIGATGTDGKVTLNRSSDGTAMGFLGATTSGVNLQGNIVTLGINSNNGVQHNTNGTWMGKGAISNTTPTALVHIAAGAAAASSAPLKFTSGSLLTTPEAGAVEFLTDAFYGTITTGAARKTFAFLESPTFTGTVSGITATMVGLGNVTNNAQTQAAIVPNTAPSAGQILIGNAGGTAYAPNSVSGDVTITSAGVTAIGATKVTNAMLAGSIAASKLVGSDIATVGTITTGTWNGTDIAVADGGTGRSTSTTAYGLIAAGTTATGPHQTLAAGATTEILVGGGASALPVWTTASGTGAPLRGTTPTIATPVLNGIPTGTGVATASTANTLALRTSSGNLAAVNVIADYTTTATAAGTTTLTVGSTYQQYFTGATTQTVTLPVTSTLTLGHSFYIMNNSTGAVTINSSGGNVVLVVAGGTVGSVTCVLTSGTTAASWSPSYSGISVVTAKKLTVNNTLTLAGTDGTTMTFPASSDTVAGLGQAQTFSQKQTHTLGAVNSLNKFTSADFSVTSNTTLADITGLSVTLVAGRNYAFEAFLPYSANVSGGVKFGTGGTVTTTRFRLVATIHNTGGGTIADLNNTGSTGAIGGLTATTGGWVEVRGYVTVNAGGTFTLQFAQNASNAAASLVVGGAYMLIRPLD